MFADYKAQIGQILENTEKEKDNQTPDKIAAAAMYKIMAGAISKFVEKESDSDPEFDAALSLDWKSAGRMLKYIWSNAEKMALKQGSMASCCLPEDAVYAWVREYYFLDDRETVMKERAEQEKAEQKRKEAKEKETLYRKKALESLSRQCGWDDLPDAEKNKKITAKVKSLKAGDSRKNTKSAEKAVTSRSKAEKINTATSVTGEKTDTILNESSDNSPEMGYSKNSIELEMEYANTLEGQMNLFNLL